MSCGFNNYYSHSEENDFSCERTSPTGRRQGNQCDCGQCHRDFTVCCNDRCFCSLAEDLCQYINQKVLVSIGGCRIPVIICHVTECIVKAIGYTNCGKVYYFNIYRIDSVDAILPKF